MTTQVHTPAPVSPPYSEAAIPTATISSFRRTRARFNSIGQSHVGNFHYRSTVGLECDVQRWSYAGTNRRWGKFQIHIAIIHRNFRS
jgi:hypothetical protein